jgi:uncharacterized YceG family protein
MSRFGRQYPGSRGERSAEERERARQEREARRRAQIGDPADPAGSEPPRPEGPDPERAAHDASAAGSEAQEAFDSGSEAHQAFGSDPVAREPFGPEPAAQAASGSEPAAHEPSTGEPEAVEHAAPDPTAGDPEAMEPADPEHAAPDLVWDEEPEWVEPSPQHPVTPAGPVHPSIASERAEHDRPMGVKRVAAGQRPGQQPRRKPMAPSGPRPAARRVVRKVAALLVVAVLAVVAWFVVSVFQPFHGAGHGRVAVRIPSGSSAGEIGDLLARRHVVSSSRFFSLRATLAGRRGDLKSGTFTLAEGMSYSAAIDALTNTPPAPPTIKVTIPEGLAAVDAAPVARRSGIKGNYVAASRRSPALDPRRYGAPKGTDTLEGFLFPATYEMKPGASAQQLVAKQLQAFKDNLAGVSLKEARRRNLTAYDVLVIASMIEREAQIDKDRPLISAVIYNRLKQHMTLGIDATIRYRLHSWTQPLTVSQLAMPSAYNTRTRQGLPPTPIGNPGLKSIEAAAHPAKVDYLFYVVKPCGNGGHAFASTDAQFQRDVARYNAARSAKGGNNPKNC